MIRITGIKVPLNDAIGALDALKLAQRALRLPDGAIRAAKISKKSVDARDKGDVHFVVSVDADCAVELQALRPVGGVQVSALTDAPYRPPLCAPCATPFARPVVVGLGPAGLFAALMLAEAGLRPIVLERGQPVDRRARTVERFFTGGPLDPESNVQFGEGGAGAFSDGKLNTGIKDPRCAHILTVLHEHGAPEEILYQAKPHIGTDRLPGVVRRIRERIEKLGGEVRFEAKLTSLVLDAGRVVGVETEDRSGHRMAIETGAVVLAIGHSARDTFEALHAQGVEMTPKAFSIGARIEHRQKLIDRAQYGVHADHPALQAADYKLSARTKSGRGVYTFCMCPGGTVVAAASEPGYVATNGMSPFARSGVNANSALLVSVEPSDYGDGHPLSGLLFQRQWERAAFEAGGGNYRAPAQLLGDFLRGVPSRGPQGVEPSYRPGVTFGRVDTCLPRFAVDALREGLTLLDRRLHGFASANAVLTGVETRSSSPLRIPRGADGQSALRGLFPCGEGAGYAGGILSAAVDGIKAAEAVIACETGAK